MNSPTTDAKHFSTFENLYYGSETGAEFAEAIAAGRHARQPEELWNRVREVSIARAAPIDNPVSARPAGTDDELLAFLASVSPFHYLSRAKLRSVLENVEEECYRGGDVLSFRSKKRICIVRTGVILVLRKESKDTSGQFVTALDPRSTFGETECLLGEAYARFVAGHKTSVLTVPSEFYVDLLRNESSMLSTVSRNLRDKQNIFEDTLELRSVCRQAVTKGHLDLNEALEAYKKIKPCIHRDLDSPRIDVSAWAYAINRLPENITSNFVYFLTRKFNPHIAGLSAISQQVETKARRRVVLQVRAGMSVILIRETESDLLDFVCNLCIHIIESQKLRKMLVSPLYLRLLNSNVSEKELTAQLPFDEDTLAGLKQMFGNKFVEAIGNIVAHHENYSVPIDIPRSSDFNIGTAERWSLSLKETVETVLQCPIEELDEVHLVSSNMHSIVNCLSSFAFAHRDRLLKFGQEKFPDLCEAGLFEYEMDLLYVLAGKYAQVNSAFAKEKNAYEAERGFYTMTNTDFTGIQVNIIPLHRVKVEDVDAGLRIPSHIDKSAFPNKKVLLVNIDFCFGAQGTSIIGTMCRLFGQKVRSVSIFGKAGGIEGTRGDISVASEIILHATDDVLRFPNQFVDVDVLRSMTGRHVFHGPMLTVYGTLMQNDASLLYYKNLYGAVGLEMEAYYYGKAIAESQMLGIVRSDLPVSFMYYTSDVPMEKGSTLSRQMSPAEGVPPLYAVTRAVLSSILSISHGLSE
jgi:hypothetical protein